MADRIEVDLIVEAIAKGFDNVTKQQRAVTDEAKKQPKVLQKLQDNWLAVAGAVGGAMAAIQAIKKVWDFAREGAQIRQTGESFDFLMGKLGVTRDLLGDLRVAAAGTVDDMTLMSGTATLLAGTSDQLGKELAESTPRLLEIAKAANKLNPSLGSVSDQYQSIATGIKRASPLILDNLGLVIKVGQANENYAASIGKTVTELTAEEKQLALLNAALESGDKLIAQVGGTTEATGDAFARLATEQKNAWDRLKAGISEALEPYAEAVADNLEATNNFNDAMDRLGVKVEQGHHRYLFFVDGVRLTQTEIENLNRQILQLARDSDLTADEIVGLAQANGGLVNEFGRLNPQIRELIERQETARETTQRLQEEFDAAKEGAAGLGDEMDDLPDGVDVEINLKVPSDVESFLQESLFREGGGEQLTAAVDLIIGEGGDSLPERVRRQFAGEAVAIDAAVKVDAGLIDMEEAKKQISDALGITEEEAAGMLDPYLGRGAEAAEELGGKVREHLGAAHQDLRDSGAFQELFAPAKSDIEAIRARLNELDERRVTVWIDYKTTGQAPTERASGGPLDGITLVGERGPELIIGNTVVDAATTRRLMSLGVMPGQRRAIAGPIDGGGGSGSSGGGSGGESDFDPLDTEQRQQIRSGGGGGTTSTSGSTSTSDGSGGGGDSATVEETVQAVETTVSQTVASTVRPLLSTQLGQLANQAARAERQAEERARILLDISSGVRRLLTGDEARVAFREGAQSINREL